MSNLAGALIAILGALILVYVFTEPGDQIALAVLGGCCFGWGIVASVAP